MRVSWKTRPTDDWCWSARGERGQLGGAPGEPGVGEGFESLANLRSLFTTGSDHRLHPDLVPPHPTMLDSAHHLNGRAAVTSLGAGPGGSAN